MKPEGVPFWAALLAAFLGAMAWWTRYDFVAFDEPKSFQFHEPQVQEGGSRLGKRAIWLSASEVEPFSLVRYKVRRCSQELTGRVVAVEGQRVRMEGSELFVNGEKVDDAYRRYGNAAEFYPELIVPAGCVFVLNDRRSRGGADRYDSRNLGPIPVRAVSHVFSPKEVRPSTKGLN